jgi:predicted pyridoxine 5'-phosphate oxidase superfamily flavin-nucleotide-binding protein
MGMAERPMYHEGMRRFQDRFETRPLADRLEQVTLHTEFTDDDRAFVAGASMFFLATADASGQPECSYKGGRPGFVRVVDARTLAFPDYDGNGMFRSLGNVAVNPQVALLFIDFEKPRRLRVNGVAETRGDDPLVREFPGAALVVRVRATRIFPNCPRYIHRMHPVELSPYAPAEGHTPPVPDWKRQAAFRDVLPPDRRAEASPEK